jgi:hypothetical protein
LLAEEEAEAEAEAEAEEAEGFARAAFLAGLASWSSPPPAFRLFFGLDLVVTMVIWSPSVAVRAQGAADGLNSALSSSPPGRQSGSSLVGEVPRMHSGMRSATFTSTSDPTDNGSSAKMVSLSTAGMSPEDAADVVGFLPSFGIPRWRRVLAPSSCSFFFEISNGTEQ